MTTQWKPVVCFYQSNQTECDAACKSFINPVYKIKWLMDVLRNFSLAHPTYDTFFQLRNPKEPPQMKSPSACCSSARLPGGGVGNPPAGRGQVWWRREEVKESVAAALPTGPLFPRNLRVCVCVCEGIPGNQILPEYHGRHKLFGVLHGVLTGQMRQHHSVRGDKKGEREKKSSHLCLGTNICAR